MLFQLHLRDYLKQIMKLSQKVRAIEKLYNVLDKDIRELQEKSGIRCVANCIQCCTTPRIEATALEFYPLAYHFYKTGQIENVLAKIEQINDMKICPALGTITSENIHPGCLFYEHRGLVCRLFAYHHSTDKYGIRKLSTCKIIKTEQSFQVENANKLLQIKPLGPKSSTYYSMLQFIDFTEAQKLHPIGKAIKIAIEKVVTHFYYNGKKAM